MRKFQGFVAVAALGALVLALAGGSVLAADTGSWLVTRTASPIVIDGDTWDWLPAPQATVLLSPAISLVNAGAIESDKESSGQIYLKYDDEAVYVLGIIKDDNVVGDQAGSGIWQNTAIELWFNLGDQNVPANLADYANYMDEDYQINLTPMVGGEQKGYYYVFPGTKSAFNDNGSITVAAKLVEGGYVIEAKIPKATFPGFDGIKAGTQFGLAVSLVHISLSAGWSHMFTPAELYAYAPVNVQ